MPARPPVVAVSAPAPDSCTKRRRSMRLIGSLLPRGGTGILRAIVGSAAGRHKPLRRMGGARDDPGFDRGARKRRVLGVAGGPTGRARRLHAPARRLSRIDKIVSLNTFN